MAIIYRKGDLVSIKIDDLVFGIEPLSYMDRVSIMACLSNEAGAVIENAAKATFLTMKKAVRELSGATLLDGSAYELSFEENGDLSDESIDDLLNMETNSYLGMALSNFLKGVPTELVNPNTGKPVEGVEIIKQRGVPKK